MECVRSPLHSPTATTTTILTNQSPGRRFVHITEQCPEYTDLARIFKEILEPLYGSQEKALSQIREGKDRTAFLLYEDKNPIGVIAFKTILSDEFKEFGIQKSIEIKSLFVVNAENNSGRGVGGTLLTKAIDEVRARHLNPEFFHVTVSETKNESLNYFKKKGFEVIHVWDGRYISGTKEYLLACKERTFDLSQAPIPFPGIQDITQRIYALSMEKLSRTFVCKSLGTSRQVHWDDIHALKLLSNGNFVSGSKDNSLCIWNQNGKLVKIVRDIEPTAMDEKAWITSIGILNKDYWVSGERNGRVCLWTTEGDFVRNILPKMPGSGHVSHAFNAKRVNAIAAGLDPHSPSLFLGFPTLMDEFSFIENRTITSTLIHKNDWVYCIHPLTDKKVMNVVAGNLEVWEKTERQWKRSKLLVSENRKKRNNDREHISSLTQIEGNANLYGFGVFGGGVKVIDIQKETIVNSWQEHAQHKRVWSTENIAPQVLASSGEDKLIKIWDLRENKSVSTMGPHVGEVTSLLKLNPQTLVAGTCGRDVSNHPTTAQFEFYDLRQPV